MNTNRRRWLLAAILPVVLLAFALRPAPAQDAEAQRERVDDAYAELRSLISATEAELQSARLRAGEESPQVRELEAVLGDQRQEAEMIRRELRALENRADEERHEAVTAAFPGQVDVFLRAEDMTANEPTVVGARLEREVEVGGVRFLVFRDRQGRTVTLRADAVVAAVSWDTEEAAEEAAD